MQRLERKREAAAGQEISPESVMSAGSLMDGGQGKHGMGPLSLLHTAAQPTPVLPVSNTPQLEEDVAPSLGSHTLHLLSSWRGLGQLSLTPTTHTGTLTPAETPPAAHLIS